MFALLLLTTSVFGQRVRYETKFNGVNTLDDNLFGWYMKNNTIPATGEGEDAWALEGGLSGYVGEPYDVGGFNSSIRTLAYNLRGFSGAEYLPSKYFYASVGYSENDHDGAYVSKWMISRVFHGLKNGDEISFWTKQQYATDGQNALALAAQDVSSFGCNRPNNLQVWLSTAESFDSQLPDVGDTSTSTGTFRTLLGEVNPQYTVDGYPKDWTLVTYRIKGLPEGRTVSGRIGFRYVLPNGGYDNCKPKNEPKTFVGETFGNVRSMAGFFGGKYGEKATLALDLFEYGLGAISGQKGNQGTAIAIDDFKWTSVSSSFVDDIYDNIWYNGRGPVERLHFSYRGHPTCVDLGKVSSRNLTYFNNSNTTQNIYIDINNLEQDYIVEISNSRDTSQINKPNQSLPPFTGIGISLKLKPGLYGTRNSELLIRQGNISGPVLHEIKVSYEVFSAPKPVARCHNSYIPTIYNNELGMAELTNPSEFNNGSEPGGTGQGACGGPLRFGFAFNPLNSSEFFDTLKFGCNRLGLQTVYLVARDGLTGVQGACTFQVRVALPGLTFESDTQTYYLQRYEKGLPLTALRTPTAKGVCQPTLTPRSIYRASDNNGTFSDRTIDYLTATELGFGVYRIEWNVSYGPNPDQQAISRITYLNIIDTIKPIALCRDTAKIGFNWVLIMRKPGTVSRPELKIRDDINPRRDVNIGSYDNGFDYYQGIKKFSMYSTWYTGPVQYFADSFEIQCSNIGLTIPVTMKVEDAAGNFSTCQSVVQIVDATEPKCADITVALSPTTGTLNLTPSNILLNGVSGVCGMTNVSLSKVNFTCSDANKTIPVTVGYKGPDNIVRGCTSQVTVKSYSVPEGSCQDTIKRNITSGRWLTEIEPLVVSACGTSHPYSMWVSNFYYPNITGNKIIDFRPGFTDVTRTAIVMGDTFTCKQTYAIAIVDPVPPEIAVAPVNENTFHNATESGCKKAVEIQNPFRQDTYKDWSYTLSGANTKTVLIEVEPYARYVNGVGVWGNSTPYWLNQSDSLYPGVTTITLTATDYAGNSTTVSYTHTITELDPAEPFVGYIAAEMPTIRGNFCGETYNHYIESPMAVACQQTGFMWYFQVRDAYMGNILYELDSIPQNDGAFIPLKIGPYINQDYPQIIHFGYHDKLYGNKIYSSNSSIRVLDTISPVMVPSIVRIQSYNDSTFKHQYSIPSPIRYTNSCTGARWGYKITGATVSQSTVNPAISYNSNQQIELTMADYSNGYPSIPADSSPVVELNIGLNIIEYFILEESGIGLSSTSANYIHYVEIEDVSFPTMTCPPNDTMYRTSGACGLAVANSCSQINGFTGPFGKTRLFKNGTNPQVAINKATTPDSITFTSIPSASVRRESAYTEIFFNCAGTVSFSWEYQSNFPQFFRPFATTGFVNRWLTTLPILAGFTQNNTGVQSGTFTKTVTAGEVLKIGVFEGGGAGANGYLKIFNFSAPYATPSSIPTQPVYADNPNLFFTSDLTTQYPIGNNTINYSLTNLNNGRTTYSTQTFTVIDSFARSLNCQNKTLYLGPLGEVELNIDSVLPTSCFPVSSTTLSKSIFTGNDIGTQSVMITSIGSNNDTLTCSFNVTVLDTTRPRPNFWQLNLPLSPSGTAILSDSVVKSFFYDNHKIATTSLGRTTFTCDDLGYQNVFISVTDSVGNTNSLMAQINITPGFASIVDRTITTETCSKDSVVLDFEANPGYSLNYQWQIKEQTDSIKYWNYFTCTNTTPFLSGTFSHQFFKLKNETYVAYYQSGTSTIVFKKLDTITNNWKPALTPLAVSLRSAQSFKVHVNNSTNSEKLEVAYINDIPNSFGVQQYLDFSNSWLPLNDNGLDYFTFQSASAPVNTTSTVNFFFNHLYGNNGYYFPVNNQAKVFAVNRDTIGFSRSYSRVRDTVADWNGSMTIVRRNYDLFNSDPWTPTPGVPPIFVTNGKTIFAIRNTINQNIFFELTFNPDGVINGKDSLTTDPTGGSSLFTMETLNNIDYIAYKSANDKVCVKKYDGLNNWSAVGSLDFSDQEINRVCLGIVNNTLHLVYVETPSNRMVAKKLVNNAWIDLGSTTTNISYNDVGFELSIVDLNNEPGIYFTQNNGGTNRLIRLDEWKTIPNATTETYRTKIQAGGTNEYRCIASSSSCNIFVPSEVHKIVVTETPEIKIVSNQINVVKEGTVQLEIQTNGAEKRWQYEFGESAGILGSNQTLRLPSMTKDTTVYAFSNNGNCYSDTVSAQIFAYDSSLTIYNYIYRDSICHSEYVSIKLDTVLPAYRYSLFKKNINNEFVYDSARIDIVAPWQSADFGVIPNQTSEYRIKVEKSAHDAAYFETSDLYPSHIDFGDDSLDITNEITVEAWVRGIGNSPFSLLGIQNTNGGIYDPDSLKNWSWSGNYFNVYNGSEKRELVFPNLPASNDWIHVATTAGPNGMRIYYNGVLVASNNDSSSVPINNNKARLTLGLRGQGSKANSLIGMDEFRVWNTVRTAAEIATNKDSCLTGSETGLLVYNNFSNYDDKLRTFASQKGSDGVYQIYENKVFVKTIARNGSCYQTSEAFFLPPITIHLVSNQANLISYENYFESPDSICGGTMVQLVSKASNGLVKWYDTFDGDSVIAIGDTLRLFVNESRTIYSGAANSVCERGETTIELNDYPKVTEAEVEEYCYGSELRNNSFNISYDGNGYRMYDVAIGSTPLDLSTDNGGTGIDGERILTETDTLWVEAYNSDWVEINGNYEEVITCISQQRMPLILSVRAQSSIVSTADSSRFGEGTLTLKATAGPNQFVEWFDINGNLLNSGDTVFTTPPLTSTTQYLVRATDNDYYCSSSDWDTVTAVVNYYLTRVDTIFACESYTWEDGNTYTASDSTISYIKNNMAGVDSLIQLHLTVIPFENTLTQVNKYSMCLGDSATITIQSAQDGYHYTIVDTSTQTTIFGPVLGTGNDIVFNTGPLSHHVGYKILATDTASVSNRTLACTKQIGDVITLRVGSLYSSSEAFTCGEYSWRGQNLSQSGIYYDTLPSSQGCDSVVELHLTIFPNREHIDTVNACGSYTWYGVTYSASTTSPTRSLGFTEYGCDSIVRLHLTINNNSSVDTRVVWDSLTWIDGITYTANNTIATHTLLNAAGCDSLVTLNLTILNSASRTVMNPQTICDGGSYAFNNKVYTTAGTFRDTLYAGTGNDSIYVTVLTVNPKPATSAISGQTNPALGTTETYSVLNTSGSTYQWIITNGTQISGGTSNSISVLWSNTIIAAAVKVVETNMNGCIGDTITQNVVLPVQLLSFVGQKKNTVVELKWSTSSEQNNKGFDVERSYDATTYEKLGFVSGKGTTNQMSAYQFNDVTFNRKSQQGVQTEPALIYYRLKQIDFNGEYNYSQVVVINNKVANGQSIQFTAVPNPYQSNFELTIQSNQTSEAWVEVFDGYGKRIANQSLTLTEGKTTLSFDQGSEWKSGMYFIVLRVGDEQQTIRIIRE